MGGWRPPRRSRRRVAVWATGLIVAVASPVSAQTSAATLRGMIVDSSTGDALTRALIFIEGSPVETTTDHNGIFTLGPVPNGQYQLTVVHDGYRARGFAFSITPELPRDIDIGVMSLAPLPHRSIALRGVITDVNSGSPIKDAVITVNGEIQTETGGDGRFDIQNYEVLEGPQSIFVRKIGFESMTYPVTVTEDRTEFDLDLRIQPLPRRLDDIIVEGRPVSAKLADFFARRALGDGEYLAPWEIEEIPARSVTDYLKTMRGVLVTPGTAYDDVRLTRGCSIPPRVFVDGVEVRNYSGVARIVSHLDVQAIEVYHGASSIPLQFQRNSRTDGCGVIVFWTR